MKIMNIGYNQATQQYKNNQQNPTAFQSCTVKIAKGVGEKSSGNFFSAISKLLMDLANKEYRLTKTETNVTRHVKAQPASLNVYVHDVDSAEVKPIVDQIVQRFPQDKTGISVELTQI